MFTQRRACCMFENTKVQTDKKNSEKYCRPTLRRGIFNITSHSGKTSNDQWSCPIINQLNNFNHHQHLHNHHHHHHHHHYYYQQTGTYRLAKSMFSWIQVWWSPFLIIIMIVNNIIIMARIIWWWWQWWLLWWWQEWPWWWRQDWPWWWRRWLNRTIYRRIRCMWLWSPSHEETRTSFIPGYYQSPLTIFITT